MTVNGWIALDKPPGLTSTQAIGKVRRILNASKIGHGGTLDPLATGVLPIALGEATKTIPFIVDHLKTYTFTVQWGEQRSTDDLEGDVTASSPVRPTKEQIEAILPHFTGNIMQIPPQFSAIKIDGERAYDLARSGEAVEIKARPVYIQAIELIEIYSPDQAIFRCVCGPGTYVRSLARDMGKNLGTYGFIATLRRDRVGPLRLEGAISLETLEKTGHSALLPVETVLDGIPALVINQQEAVRLKQGQKLSFISRPDAERLRKIGEGDALAVYDGTPVALVTVEGITVHPVRIFNL